MIVDLTGYPRLDVAWQDRAACRGRPTSWFFPSRGRPDLDDDQSPSAAIVALCSACPVRAACLDYALTLRITDGYWGGLTARQRRDLARGRPQLHRLEDSHHGRRRAPCGCLTCRAAG